MTTSPLFSIITITRNNIDGFLQTRQSVENQSFQDFEWIVIDGDSTDGTKNILPENSLSEPDIGIYDAMNKGIDRATGAYLLFLNAGDALSDMDILSTLSKTITFDKPDFIYGDALETGGYYKKARSHESLDWGMFTHHQAMMYRREVIGDLRYDIRYRIAGDYAFTRAFLSKARKVTYIPAALCIFETGGISQTNMRCGRIEQYKARHAAGCAMVRNLCVFGGQSVAAAVKTIAPQLYSGVRSKMVARRRPWALSVK